jgi:tRNA threonylcarbamoyladenosine biosynthesis protein TsaE
MKKVITTHSFEQTQDLGRKFAENLKGGEVLALHGDLGSGKTTFVQGLAKGLGITQRIISPTFIIMRTYQVIKSSSFAKGFGTRSSHPPSPKASAGQGQVIKSFYHVDLYRIETERDVEGLGLLELMGDPGNIVVIEWPDKIANLLPENRMDMFFEYVDEERRKIILA